MTIFQKRWFQIFLLCLMNIFSSYVVALSDERSVKGAQLFFERCVLCHGSKGMGDGVLTLLVGNYPSANLMQQRYGTEREAVIDNIRFGGAQGKMSFYSPPWEGELTDKQIHQLADFILYLYAEPEAAAGLLARIDQKTVREVSQGRFLFLSRCAVCHGEEGKGDGKLAGKLIKNPAPFDLTQSVLPAELLQQIISLGGAGVGRSGNMPPWKDEFSRQEIAAVVAFLMTIRTQEVSGTGDL